MYDMINERSSGGAVPADALSCNFHLAIAAVVGEQPFSENIAPD